MLFQTVSAVNYLPMAFVLADSLREHISGARVSILVTDASPAVIARLNAAFPHIAQFVGCDGLGIDWIDDMRSYYTVFEMSSACKVLALHYQLNVKGESECCFVDPDMLALGDFTGAMHDVHKDIVLTYHTQEPYPQDAELPNERELAILGAANGGFLYMKKTPRSLAALAWLVDKTRYQWFAAPSYGMFCDQHWLSFLPQFFPDATGILWEQGVNIAYWNLHERPLHRDGGKLQMKKSATPALLFHFSGFPDSGDRLSKHSHRAFDTETQSALHWLIPHYRALLEVERQRVIQSGIRGDLPFSALSLGARLKRAQLRFGQTFTQVAPPTGRFGRLGNLLDRLVG